MSYKIKSALYFVSFLAAVSIYHSLDNNIQLDAIAEKVDLEDTKVVNNDSDIITYKEIH